MLYSTVEHRDSDLELALRKAFDQRLAMQSPSRLQCLRQARRQALADERPKSLFTALGSWLRTPWQPVSTALAASILLAALVFPLSQGSDVGRSQWSEDMAMLEVDPGLDTEDELDFYLWLDANS